MQMLFVVMLVVVSVVQPVFSAEISEISSSLSPAERKAASIVDPTLKFEDEVPVEMNGGTNVVGPKNKSEERAFTKKVERILSSAQPRKKVFVQVKRFAKRVNDDPNLQVTLGLGISSFQDWNTLGQPTGFGTESSDSNGVNMELAVTGRYKWVGFEWIPLEKSRELATKFYGSSLGKIDVTRDLWFVGRIFLPISNPKYSVFLGLGVEHNKLDGNLMMGGFPFPTKGGGYSPVLQVGGQYRMNDRLSLEGGYNKRNVEVASEPADVPDITSKLEGSYFARVHLRFLGKKP